MVFVKNLIVGTLFTLVMFSCKGSNVETFTFIPPPEIEILEGHKIVSFNLRVKTPTDAGDRDWNNRKIFVRQLLVEYDVDIVGTQEGLLVQIEDIIDDPENSPYAYTGVGRDDGNSLGETCAILYKKAKYQLLDNGTFWLSETPETPSYGFGANYRRICTWAKFKEILTGKEFYFFNAHYDHEVELARVESSKIVIDRIKSITNNKPFFLTGDFNCMPSSNPIQLLLESGLLVDTRTVDTAVIEGPEGTFHGYNLQRIPTDRIDYVFVSNGMDVKNNIHIDRDRITGQISSDHLPVLSTVSF